MEEAQTDAHTEDMHINVNRYFRQMMNSHSLFLLRATNAVFVFSHSFIHLPPLFPFKDAGEPGASAVTSGKRQLTMDSLSQGQA